MASEEFIVIDPAVIEELKQLQAEADPQLLEVLIGMYFRTTPERLARLGDSIHAQDSLAVAAVAHDLKSSSANLGVRKVRDICFDLEEVVKVKDWPRLLALHGQLIDAFGQAKGELEALLQGKDRG